MIHGITITLINREVRGTDAFGAPIYVNEEVEVENVLVAPLSSSDSVNNTDLVTNYESYQLGLPKGDNHKWENNFVRLWGKVYKVVGVPIGGIEAMIPLEWNKKVTIELYE